MDKAHDIGNVTVSGSVLHLDVDGKSYEIDLAKESPRLAHATQAQREPAVDEDLSVDGLIGVRHPSPLVTAEA